MIPLQAIVDLGAMKVYSVFPKVRALLSVYLVSYLGHSLGVVLLLRRDAVGVFYNPTWLSKEFEIQTNHRILAKEPDQVLFNKKKKLLFGGFYSSKGSLSKYQRKHKGQTNNGTFCLKAEKVDGDTNHCWSFRKVSKNLEKDRRSE